jgi:hypothetical protein
MSEEFGESKSRPRLDPTINYGHILTVISLILAGVGAYFGVRGELMTVDLRVAKIESTLQQLANVVVLTARQDEKLNAIERRVDRMEQGR